MTQPTFAHLALAAIASSPTNPRKTFDAAKLAELTESVKASGVHQPVLVRPLPGHRLEDTAHLKPRPEYELVAGERRMRASIAAGVVTIPAMITQLTDDQALEVQIVENLQRDDLSELEEAEGYDHLMRHSHLTAEGVAGKIGKSRSYVYGRLKLLDLCQEARQALASGEIDASKGLLLARIPDTKLQIKALEEIDQGSMSTREAQDHIQRRYMLRLDSARFKITDVDLLPAAGSCRACPKRTGADPDLFADVKAADTCTDPTCFKAKEQAHSDALMRSAHERGQTIIDGREAKALIPYGYDPRVEGHRRLDTPADSPTDQPLRKLIGKVMEERGVQPVLVANPHKEGELIACLPNEQVAELLVAASAKNKKAAEAAEKVQQQNEREAEQEAESAKAKAKTDFESAWRWDMLTTTWAHIKVQTSEPWDGLLRHIALGMANGLNTDQCKRLCKLLDLGKVAPKDGFVQWVKDVPDAHLAVQLLVMFRDVEYRHWLPADRANEGLLLVGEAYGVTTEDVQDKVKQAARAAVKAAKTAEAQKAPLPLPPAAQAGGVRGESEPEKGKKPGKRKGQAPAAPALSPEEAMLGIAAAMQGQEAVAESGHGEAEPVGGAAAEGLNERPAADEGPAGESGQALELKIGARVRVVGVSLPGDTATVIAHKWGSTWEIRLDAFPDGSTYMLGADELEVLPGEPAAPEATPGEGATDPVYEAAKATVINNNKASISYVQRVHRIGYRRAATILEAMETAGLVTHMDEKGLRTVVEGAQA